MELSKEFGTTFYIENYRWFWRSYSANPQNARAVSHPPGCILYGSKLYSHHAQHTWPIWGPFFYICGNSKNTINLFSRTPPNAHFKTSSTNGSFFHCHVRQKLALWSVHTPSASNPRTPPSLRPPKTLHDPPWLMRLPWRQWPATRRTDRNWGRTNWGLTHNNGDSTGKTSIFTSKETYMRM